MGIAIRIDVLDPPLDVEAMHRLVRSLPGVVERATPFACYQLTGDGAPVGESPWFWIGADHVWVAVHWSDNRYGHAGFLAHHVLDHHRCRGTDDDRGSDLVDNHAVRTLLAAYNVAPVPSPTARRAAVVRHLTGLFVQSLRFAAGEVTIVLDLPDGDGPRVTLEAEVDACEVHGGAGGADLDLDERAVVGLYRMIYGRVAPHWGDDGVLVLTVHELALRLLGPWRATDPAGREVIRTGASGALWVDPALPA